MPVADPTAASGGQDRAWGPEEDGGQVGQWGQCPTGEGHMWAPDAQAWGPHTQDPAVPLLSLLHAN